jgi:hypothetical protein
VVITPCPLIDLEDPTAKFMKHCGLTLSIVGYKIDPKKLTEKKREMISSYDDFKNHNRTNFNIVAELVHSNLRNNTYDDNKTDEDHDNETDDVKESEDKKDSESDGVLTTYEKRIARECEEEETEEARIEQKEAEEARIETETNEDKEKSDNEVIVNDVSTPANNLDILLREAAARACQIIFVPNNHTTTTDVVNRTIGVPTQ